MNGLEEEPMAPQTFLYGCALEAGKDVTFNPEDEEFEHQLDLRMACVDSSTKDELHMVEVEGQDVEGQKIKAVLVSLKPSTLPSVCLGGFTLTPPVSFRLKTGSGPVHLSGQHLVMAIDDSNEEEEEEDDEEGEEEEDIKAVQPSKKRPATSPADKSKKKMKIEMDDEEDSDEDDEDEEDDDDEEEDVTPIKTTPKSKLNTQNGKSPKPSTPGQKKEVKTPKGKGDKSPKTPATPREPLTIPQLKEKMLECVSKGVTLPKIQAKFENFVKNSFRISDGKVFAELWAWRQTV